MKKLFALLLCVCLLAVLAACGEKPAGTDAPGTEAPVSTEPVSEFVPTGKTYADAEFNILVAGMSKANYAFKDFTDAEGELNALDQAVYKKNAAVEELYGVKILAEESPKNGLKLISTAVMAGDTPYDAAFVAAYDAVPLAIGDNLYELGSIEGLHLENSYWDQKANEQLSFKGCRFFTTGDISYWDDMQQNVVAFNKGVKNTVNIADDFYALVDEGKWTQDALASYAKLVTEDLNADGNMDMSDRFGIITWDDSIYAIFEGSGEQVVTVDDAGKLNLTLTGSERIINVLSKYTDICFGGDAINYQRYTANEAIAMFSSNRALFFLGRLQSLDNYRDMETDYGILPYPKYDETQKEYHTVASPYHMTFVCVPKIVESVGMSGDVLEALAYYGQQEMTPAYYEKTLTGKYFRDPDSEATLSLMSQTRAYDFGLYIQPANINKELIYLFREGAKTFASTFDSYKSAATTALDEMSTAYTAAAAAWNK